VTLLLPPAAETSTWNAGLDSEFPDPDGRCSQALHSPSNDGDGVPGAGAPLSGLCAWVGMPEAGTPCLPACALADGAACVEWGTEPGTAPPATAYAAPPRAIAPAAAPMALAVSSLDRKLFSMVTFRGGVSAGAGGADAKAAVAAASPVLSWG
jgi:hypothetical protein